MCGPGIRIVFLLAILQPGVPSSPRVPNQAASTPAVSPAPNPSQRGPIRAARSVASAEERKAFIEAMVKAGDPAIATTIARFIDDPDPGVATAACWALGELRNRETSSQAVRGMQQNSMAVVRATCAIGVGRIGDPQNAPALNAAASNEKEETDVRLASIQALAMFDTEQGSGLVPLLANRDPRIRASAAYSACQLQVPAAVEPIKSMLRSSDSQAKRYALDAVGVWPEAFYEELVRIAADSRESPENRLLSITSLMALPREQKNTGFVKSVSGLLEPEQPREVQVAAAQILSEVPEGRPILEKIAKDGHRAPELLQRLREIGFETAAPVVVTTPNSTGRNYTPSLEGLIGVVLGAGIVLLANYLRDRRDRERYRKEEIDWVRKITD